MRSVLVIVEGAAHQARPELEGQTPLQLARGVNWSAAAHEGRTGWINWTRSGVPRRAETALAMMLGASEAEANGLTRGAVEAAGAGLDTVDKAWVYRGNLSTIDLTYCVREERVSSMTDEETRELMDSLKGALERHGATAAMSDPARLLVLLDRLDGEPEAGTPPWIGSPAWPDNETPRDPRSQMMRDAAAVLETHGVNDVRIDLGENPANCLWLWGGGTPVRRLRPFLGAPLRACAVSNSPLMKGIAALSGFEHHALGSLWMAATRPEIMTAERMRDLFARHELTIVYVESSRECGRYGGPLEKVKGLDRIDIHVMARVMQAARELGDTRVTLAAALPDEVEYTAPGPVLVWDRKAKPDRSIRWDETSCQDGSIGAIDPTRLIAQVIGE